MCGHSMEREQSQHVWVGFVYEYTYTHTHTHSVCVDIRWRGNRANIYGQAVHNCMVKRVCKHGLYVSVDIPYVHHVWQTIYELHIYVCMYTHIYIYELNTYVCIYIYIYIYIYISIHTEYTCEQAFALHSTGPTHPADCRHAHSCKCMYTFLCLYVYVLCSCVCMSLCLYVCMYTYVYVYTYTQT